MTKPLQGRAALELLAGLDVQVLIVRGLTPALPSAFGWAISIEIPDGDITDELEALVVVCHAIPRHNRGAQRHSADPRRAVGTIAFRIAIATRDTTTRDATVTVFHRSISCVPSRTGAVFAAAAA